jgi:hypothetical protein
VGSSLPVTPQGIHVFICPEYNVTALTAITAIRSTVRDILLTAKPYSAITAVTCFYPYLSFIKHKFIS